MMSSLKRERLPQAMVVFLWLCAALTLLSLGDATVQSLHYGLAKGAHLIFPPDPFYDLGDYRDRFLLRHSQQFFTSHGYPWFYPAPAIFVLYPFYLLDELHVPHLYVAAYVTVAMALVLIAGVLFHRRLRKAGATAHATTWFVVIAMASSWSVYIALQRGNIEILLWPLLAAGIWLAERGRWMRAAILIGAVASVKIYPLLFLGLFLRTKRWKEIGVGLTVFAAVTLLALYFLEPNLADSFRRTMAGVNRWTTDYAVRMAPNGYDHSLFGQIKRVVAPSQVASALRIYLVVAGVVTSAWFLLRIAWLPLVNQALFLACAAVLLPPASFDYTLGLVNIPLAWLSVLAVQAEHKGSKTKGTMAAFILLAFVTAPETFAVVNGEFLASILKAVCLFGLLVVASVMRIEERV
jgi:hypothetical protein